MPIDRAATLKGAEKLLRQGKLDSALAEYLRIVEEEPRDWNTANILGDLYVRAGKTDKAVEQFLRIADHLHGEGFSSKASALYKKILKIHPNHDYSGLRLADIAAGQGLLADARAYLKTVLERRSGRGDAAGAAEVRIRLASIDPEDLDSRLEGARARVAIDDREGALRELGELAVGFSEAGRPAEALEALKLAATVDPESEEIREKILDLYLANGDYANARLSATSADQSKALAARLDSLGQQEESLQALRDAARQDPSDSALKAHLARAFVDRGELEHASEFMSSGDGGEDDPRLLLAIAEMHLRQGRLEEGLLVVRRLVSGGEWREEVALLGWSLAEREPEAAFQVVEIVADDAVSKGDWAAAAAALEEFVTRVPDHVPALMRLVDVSVDGGLEAMMYGAQARLADAYLVAGMAAEARFIAEDLVAREPWEQSNIERFRRALVAAGEADPDAIIAARLSGDTPFSSTDLSTMDEEDAGESAEPVVLRHSPEVLRHPPGEEEEEAAEPLVPPHADSMEVDLSVVLQGIQSGGEAPVGVYREPRDLEDVFAQFRDEASRRAALDAAQEAYDRALELQLAGRIDECISALEAASRAPRLRFETASMLGRLHRERENTLLAIEWFERAAQAPAHSVQEGQQLLYELADALESVGESARALAIFMEVQADTADYRDVSARVDRLSKTQA